MKPRGTIGIFDSGLGGLFTMRSIVRALPEYDFVYLGDTKHLPYGNKSARTIYRFLKKGVDFLFKHDCELVIVACNTASTEALRPLQQTYLKKHYPDRRVLGVIVPTIEEVKNGRRIGIIATHATTTSGAYPRELMKVHPKAKIFQSAAPMLVPLIENGETGLAGPFLKEYLAPLLRKKIDTLILGCTHYPMLKKEIKKIVGKKVKLISQDEFIHKKLKSYLVRHPEIEQKLSQKRMRRFFVTEKTPHFETLAKKWFGKAMNLVEVDI